MEKALQALLDKQEIHELMCRYSRTLDWLDDEGQALCYWPDAEIDYGFFKGKAADFVPFVMDIERASKRRWHMLNSLQIVLHDDSHASGECYGLATGLNDNDGTMKGNLFGGRYLDEFEKRDGEWRISARRYFMDWMLPLPAQPDGTVREGFVLPMLDLTQSGNPHYRPM